MIETEISYASFGNYRKRLANNRFRQELVCIGSDEGDVHAITKSLYLSSKSNKRVVATIIHDEAATLDDFHKKWDAIEFPYFRMDFELDGVKYEHYSWTTEQHDNIDGEMISVGGKTFLSGRLIHSCDHYRPLVCWVCNRLFMNPTNYVHYQDKWVALNHAPIWCSPACQVKFASFQLARKRKAERQAIDKSTACQQCGVPFIPKRLGSRFCSSNCRLKSHRLRSLISKDTP